MMSSLVWPILILCLSLSGCGPIMVGQPVEKMDLSSQDDVQENLKAIRAMQADQAAPPVVNPPDASSMPVPPNESKPVPGSSSQLSHAPPPSASPIPNASAPAKLPWTPSSVTKPSPPDRSVPAYTVPAPVGPDYSGSVRCAPDGMGGQRCVAR